VTWAFIIHYSLQLKTIEIGWNLEGKLKLKKSNAIMKIFWNFYKSMWAVRRNWQSSFIGPEKTDQY